MTKETWKRIIAGIIALVVLVAVILYISDQPVTQGATNLTSLELSEDLSVGDDVSITGDLASGMFIATASQLTPSNNDTLTIAASFNVINSSGDITITLGTTNAVAGQLVWLYGDDAHTVLIADTNILTSDGNALSIGQYDAVEMIFNGTKWVELLKIANQ
jgi:hypothetical protein